MGGYQKPGSPAPVSGPGALSRRTDGGPAQPVRDLPNAQYGEAAEYRTLQQSAPLQKAPSVPSSPTPGGTGGPALVGLGEASQYPDQPVTNGAALGAGAGVDALGLPLDDRADVRARLAAVYQLYPSEDLRQLLELMDSEG